MIESDKMEKYLIKNMVCHRCVLAVQSEFEKINAKISTIKLGEVVLKENLNEQQKQDIENSLTQIGFEIINDKRRQIIDKIKTIIIEMVHYGKYDINANLSDILSREVNYDYNYLSNLFSEIEGVTIEKYYIAQKIEKVKELLVYDELSLSEIAFKLNYSSAAYLSNQFKKTTGLSPSHFKNMGKDKRKPLDKV